MKHLLPILAIVTLSAGCAHQARTFTPPAMPPKLAAAARTINTTVPKARATAERARVSIETAKTSAAMEAQAIKVIAPKVNDLLERVPPELKAEVQALKDQVATLEAEHPKTVASIAEASTAHLELKGQLDTLESARLDFQKYGPEYEATVADQTAKLNTAEQAWHKDSAEIVKMKESSWLYRILGILGAVVLVGLTILYFTGKIALGAASVAKTAAVLLVASLALSACRTHPPPSVPPISAFDTQP